MKNTLILNLTTEYQVEHLSSVNEGDDAFILQLKTPVGAGVNVRNTLGDLNASSGNYLFTLEIPKPNWIGLGSETLTITVGAGEEAVQYALTIAKTPACGGNYQAIMVDDTTIRFQKQKMLNEDFFSVTEEQIVGTWIDGKPIYRKIVMNGNQVGTAAAASTATNRIFVKVESLCIDKLLGYGGYTQGDNKWFYPVQLCNNPAASNDQRVYMLLDYNNQYLSVYNYWSGKFYAYIEYTKTTDEAVTEIQEQADLGELRNEWILVWEGNFGADGYVDLPESMMRHKFIAFEVRNAAPTTAGHGLIYTIPTEFFKAYDNKQENTVRSYYLFREYDNYNTAVEYMSDTQFYFDFGSTLQLRRVWFVD